VKSTWISNTVAHGCWEVREGVSALLSRGCRAGSGGLKVRRGELSLAGSNSSSGEGSDEGSTAGELVLVGPGGEE
jgi:hypothetical protein